MTITLYGLKNCDGCKKALKHIQKSGTDVELIDVREHPLSDEQLSSWCARFGRESFVNKRSTTWRGLTDAQKDMSSDADAIALIKSAPALMKRPVIVSGNTALLGFKPADVDKLL